MVLIIKQKWPLLPISILRTGAYKHGGRVHYNRENSHKTAKFFRNRSQ